MWSVEFSREARKQLEKVDAHIENKIVEKIRNLKEWLNGESSAQVDIKRLGGEWKDFHRIRTGKIRILLSMDNRINTIRIHAIGFRGDVYKK
ncbi:MAG: type II toxin-antitoxin system RelE/ParE family toxin [Candidatus Aminicenantes bacterium]|nr:type II toxin-antitoxin system RelE/ParE family toxin [Candidatus Aminicenantes bacterium]